MSKPYSEQISDAQVMLSGLKNNEAQLIRRGIDHEFVVQMDNEINSAIELNNQQEKLKADLKQKTAELEAMLAEVRKKMSESKKIVKMDVPKDQWKEFGITDKR